MFLRVLASTGHSIPRCRKPVRRHREAGSNAGESREATPHLADPAFHDLRHWYAVDYLQRGGSIYTLLQILGPSSIKTTELYLAC
jgi:site-specific recombinase XerD